MRMGTNTRKKKTMKSKVLEKNEKAKTVLREYKKGILGVDSKFKEKHGKKIFKIYKTINASLKNLESGRSVFCDRTGAKIVPERTGSAKGTQNRGTFSIELNGEKFFLKIADPKKIVANYDGYLKTREMIGKHWKQGNIKLRVMKPHIFFTYKNKGLIVTDFFKAEEEKMVSDILKNKKNEKNAKNVEKTITRAKNFLRAGGVEEVSGVNAFYNHKTKTITLFDLLYWK